MSNLESYSEIITLVWFLTLVGLIFTTIIGLYFSYQISTELKKFGIIDGSIFDAQNGLKFTKWVLKGNFSMLKDISLIEKAKKIRVITIAQSILFLLAIVSQVLITII